MSVWCKAGVVPILVAGMVAATVTDTAHIPVPPYVPIVEADPPKIDTESLKCLAKNIYFEARNQSREGMKAIAFVVMNRVQSSKFPNAVCDVVQQAWKNPDGSIRKHKCQFSWYCDGKPDVPRDLDKWVESMIVASRVAHGFAEDNTRGATHYHAAWMPKKPHWAAKDKRLAKVGDHIFYQ